MFSSNCCFLTCIQISQETGKVVWYSHHLKNFPQFVVIHTVKGFGIFNKAEIDAFLELSCFFDDPGNVGNLISCSSAFSKTILKICNFTVHVFLKSGLQIWALLYYCVRWVQLRGFWTIFGNAFLWGWNENWPFPVLWPLLSFPNFLTYWVQYFDSIIY